MTTVTSYNPRLGSVASTVDASTADELERVVGRAALASRALLATDAPMRAAWLHALANSLDQHLDELARIADVETALGPDRLRGEVARTANQLRFYAEVATEGSYLGASIETDDTGRVVLGRANQPLGPVAVFGASNFPFVFGVLGNDTGSAIAAGCPVIVKAHDAHVATSLLTAEIAERALAAVGAPEGLLACVVGFEAGVALVKHPSVSAVGFTGSQQGGQALWRLSNERETVIPVFAEMGTINPAVVTPSVVDFESVARGFVAAFTQGSGQFCTKPGLLFAPRSAQMTGLIMQALETVPPAVMLTKQIADRLQVGAREFEAAGATSVAGRLGPSTGWSGDATVMTAPIELIEGGSRLLEECFGPIAIVVEYDDIDQVLDALGRLQGGLAASVFVGDDLDPDASEVVQQLSRSVGRVCVNAWTPGVSCTWAQHHGGPWPATSNPSATSMGAAALDRWLRPVAFQTVPDAWLPPTLQALNPLGIPRRVNGNLVVGEGQ